MCSAQRLWRYIDRVETLELTAQSLSGFFRSAAPMPPFSEKSFERTRYSQLEAGSLARRRGKPGNKPLDSRNSGQLQLCYMRRRTELAGWHPLSKGIRSDLATVKETHTSSCTILAAWSARSGSALPIWYINLDFSIGWVSQIDFPFFMYLMVPLVSLRIDHYIHDVRRCVIGEWESTV